MRQIQLALFLMAFPAILYSQPLSTSTSATASRVKQCISEAASYHHVNADVLAAIVQVESNGNGRVIARNSNNSIDVGLVGTNSIHFSELKSKGVAPENLLDECVALYVGAWMYSKKIYKHGNTWRAIGAYNSETPSCNYRYQKLIHNELMKMGVIPKTQYLSIPSKC